MSPEDLIVKLATCERGHPRTPANTYVNPTTGKRYCRPCRANAPSRRRLPPRLPFAPILDELEARGCTNRRRQAEWLGVNPRQLYRWLEIGVPFYTADRLAVMLERHPVTFWPDFFSPEPLTALSPSTT